MLAEIELQFHHRHRSWPDADRDPLLERLRLLTPNNAKPGTPPGRQLERAV
jgi:hypothetical protein